MKGISTDIFAFEELRKSNALYVDKTQYVWNIVSGVSRTFFLSRPRRMGKSLLLSTFKAYFEGKKELFEGLEIEKLKTDEWEKFPVIHLDLACKSSHESYATVKMMLQKAVADAAMEMDVDVKESLPSAMLSDLINGTFRKYGKQVVILVDEYDKPILDSMNKPYIDDVLGMMAEFYQQLKSANAKERFVFITGVTKFAHVSLFSGANNPTDLTRNPKYATMLGYTEEELRANFSEYIDELATTIGADRDALLGEIKRWYNGLRFVRECESVYNPVSIGKLFANMRFDNYWIATGTPRIMLNMIKNNPFELNDFTQMWQEDVTEDKYDLNDIDVSSVAIQTGYLSIAEWRRASMISWDVRYDFPNKEIRDCWFKNILTLKKNKNFSLNPLLYDLDADLKSKNAEAFMDKVVRFFSGIPYENAGEISEGYFRNQLRTLFCLFGIPNQCEIQQASQRVDIVAQTKEMALVFELKMLSAEDSGNETALLTKLNEAKAQALKNGYAENYKNESEIVKSIAIVFDEKTRKVATWEEV